jgi:hypothetical protein
VVKRPCGLLGIAGKWYKNDFEKKEFEVDDGVSHFL